MQEQLTETLTLADGLTATITVDVIIHPPVQGDRTTPSQPAYAELLDFFVDNLYLDGEELSCPDSFRMARCIIESDWSAWEQQLCEEALRLYA